MQPSHSVCNGYIVPNNIRKWPTSLVYRLNIWRTCRWFATKSTGYDLTITRKWVCYMPSFTRSICIGVVTGFNPCDSAINTKHIWATRNYWRLSSSSSIAPLSFVTIIKNAWDPQEYIIHSTISTLGHLKRSIIRRWKEPGRILS